MSAAFRRLSVSLAFFFAAVIISGHLTNFASANAAVLPAGIPATGTAVKVHRVIDGDQIYVALGDGTLQHVILAGIDAPNEGDCYYEESKSKLEELLQPGTTVYLEASGTVDNQDGRPVRYVWIAGADGSKAKLINSKLVREGDAGFDASLDSPKYFSNLEQAQDNAQEKEAGVWGACGELHLSERVPVDANFVLQATIAANEALARLTGDSSTNYESWISGQMTIVTGSVGQLGLIMSGFTGDSLTDPAWVTSVTALADLWKRAYNDAVAATPAPEFAEMHAAWIEAMLHYSNAADFLTSGLANLDVTGISSAANELTVGSLYISQVQQLLSGGN